MLPHEAEAQAAIAANYRVQIDAMTKLHDTIVGMMTAGSWTVTKIRGVTPLVAQMELLLCFVENLVKLRLSFRGVHGIHDGLRGVAALRSVGDGS